MPVTRDTNRATSQPDQKKDLALAADLASSAAEAVLTVRRGLGERPITQPEASEWDRNVAQLDEEHSTLSAQAIQLRAMSVNQALEKQWPKLTGLAILARKVEEQIKEIKELSAKLSKIAAVINLGVTIIEFFSGTTIDKANAIVEALSKARG